jgi:heptosyltransferase-2
MRVGIFHTAFIGDVIQTGLAIEALSSEGHDVILFAKKSPLSVFQGDPRVKEAYPIHKGRGLEKIRQIFTIRNLLAKQKLDLCLVPHESPMTRLIFWKSPFPWVGRVPDQDPKIHESLKILQMIPEAYLKKDYSSLARPILRGGTPLPVGTEPKFPYFLVSPGSVWATKRYPPELFAQVIGILFQHLKTEFPHLRCILAGSPEEAPIIQTILDHSKAHAHRISHTVGIWNLPQLITASRGAQFIIANDSSPFHMGVGVSTPTFGIFGPTSFERGFGPAGDRAFAVNHTGLYKDLRPLTCQPCSPHGHKVCPKGHHRCMNELSPEDIASWILSKR